MATFILVPGAWLGGWCWDDVAQLLRAAGHGVITVTLTGLAERAHLLTTEIGLDTHVGDVADILVGEDLGDAILVGHSYGGTVIASLAERVPERLRCLVFLDASVPDDGQSNNDTLPPELVAMIRESAHRGGDGWRVPPPAPTDWRLDEELRARLTPHPLRSLEQPAALRSAASRRVRRAFLRTSPPTSFYQQILERARVDGWYWRELEGGHYAMITAPLVVATALIELERQGAR